MIGSWNTRRGCRWPLLEHVNSCRLWLAAARPNMINMSMILHWWRANLCTFRIMGQKVTIRPLEPSGVSSGTQRKGVVYTTASVDDLAKLSNVHSSLLKSRVCREKVLATLR